MRLLAAVVAIAVLGLFAGYFSATVAMTTLINDVEFEQPEE